MSRLAYFQTLSCLADKAKDIYRNGGNVVKSLTEDYPTYKTEIIEIAYCLQSGTYTEVAHNEKNTLYRQEIFDHLVPLFSSTNVCSVLDCGIGEGTRWIDFPHPLKAFYGFDISLDRLGYVNQNVAGNAIPKIDLFRGDLRTIPLAENAVDTVVTMHAIEPNGGAFEANIINELIRVAGRYLCLFEPDYANAQEEMKRRMELHGYARNIFPLAMQDDRVEVVDHGKLEKSANPLNQTSFVILKKKEARDSKFQYRSPLSSKRLIENGHHLAEEDGCFVFPMIDGIKCLCPQDAIVKMSRYANSR